MLKSYKVIRWIEMKILFINNSDTFSYNLIEEFKSRNCEILVYKNDVEFKLMNNVIKKYNPNLIVISGCGSIKNSGIFKELIIEYHEKIPIFGVGLGHQCIIEAFGGRIDKAAEFVNGNSILVNHDDKTFYKKISNPFKAGNYNLLFGVDIPYELEVSARSENDLVMGVRHKEHFVEGIQFYPSSILTPLGSLIIDNLIKELSN